MESTYSRNGVGANRAVTHRLLKRYSIRNRCRKIWGGSSTSDPIEIFFFSFFFRNFRTLRTSFFFFSTSRPEYSFIHFSILFPSFFFSPPPVFYFSISLFLYEYKNSPKVAVIKIQYERYNFLFFSHPILFYFYRCKKNSGNGNISKNENFSVSRFSKIFEKSR